VSREGIHIVFVIEDELHAEWQGEFSSFQQALDELRRRAAVPWNEEPNRAPCVGWEKCGRQYEVIEYDDAADAREVRRVSVLAVTAAGVKWSDGFDRVD
jgi:hypothetical protein